MFDINPLLLTDGYKLSHQPMHPPGTNFVYSNLTPRKSRQKDVNHVVFFGLQYYLKAWLQTCFNENFFNLDEDVAIRSFKRVIDSYLGVGQIGEEPFRKLHQLGYLPLKIKAVPEGLRVPIGVPVMTICNTHPDFAWFTNFVESHLSCSIWGSITSATTAFQYRQILEKWAMKTTGSIEGIEWQAHDFSFRGMNGVEAGMMSGAAHLTSFHGTDSIPSIWFLEQFYNANCKIELVGGSVPASEHSVMCLGTKEGEEETYRRIIQDVHPKGIVALVSDTWDLWNVVNVILVNLKDKIMAREGKLVIRPDSGDPVHILCGYTDADFEIGYCGSIGMIPKKLTDFQAEVEREGNEVTKKKGLVESLWDIFGGTINDQGYKVLDPHIGAIYGDSITLARAEEICARLEAKGFASTNVVLGVGSYSYQFVTRDTYGFAIKATYAEVGGVPREIFKDPITDDGTKKSLKGLLSVYRDDDGELKVKDQCTKQEEEMGLLRTVFEDGELQHETDLGTIREMIDLQAAELLNVE